MSTVNYQIRDNRYVPLSGINYDNTIADGNTVTLGPIGTANFAAIIQEIQSSGQVNIGLRFSNDSVTWSSYTSNNTALGTNLAIINTTILGSYVMVRIVNSSGFGVSLNIVSYGSMTTVPATVQDTFRDLNDPIQDTDPLLLTKGIISGSLGGTGISNASLLYPGSLEIGQYNSTMTQRMSSPVFYGSLPKNLSEQNIGNYSGSNTVTTSTNNGTILTSTGLTIVESSSGTKYETINDTFVLRFNANFVSGDSFITFGDQYVGIGVSSGSFAITYMSGNVSQVYTQLTSPVDNGTSSPTFTLGGTSFGITGVTYLTGPRVTLEALSNNVPFSAYFINGRAFFRRVGPALNSSAASVTGNTSFYAGQPTMISGTFGTTNTIVQGSFNIDHMDGTGYLPAIVPANGVSGELVFTADGNILLMITDPRNGSLVPVHRAKIGTRLFTGDHSRISVRSNVANTVIYDASVYGHPEKNNSMLQYSYSGGSYWPNNPATTNNFLYLIGLTKNNKAAKVSKVTISMPDTRPPKLYLLKNTIMLPQTEVLPYTSTDITFAPLSDNSWFPGNNTYGVSVDTTDKYFNQVIDLKNVDQSGSVTFEGPQLDYFDSVVIGFNPGIMAGMFKYDITVEYSLG